jgi:hypothetical protein
MHYAMMWAVKPDAIDQVKELFANYGRPDHVVKDEDGNVRGMLLGTQVFMKDNLVVRVIEVEGDFVAVAQHMGRQPAIQELESALDDLVLEPRDMSTPEGARDFFIKSAMECLIDRRHDDPDQ